jgi:hypothetical protein
MASHSSCVTMLCDSALAAPMPYQSIEQMMALLQEVLDRDQHTRELSDDFLGCKYVDLVGCDLVARYLRHA